MSDEEKGYEPPQWLLTYGDMVTLLVTFFVMLISLSTLNMDKYKKVNWDPNRKSVEGGESVLEGFAQPVENVVTNDLDIRDTEVYDESQVASDKVYDYLVNFINENNMVQYVDVEDIKIGFKINIPVDMCFEKGQSLLKKEASAIFRNLGTAFRKIPGNIVIDADVGANGLSIDRTANICDFLVNREDIKPQRIAMSGYYPVEIAGKGQIGILVLKK